MKEIILFSVEIFLGILSLLALIRAILGPTIADRIMAVNMMDTMVMVMICGLAILLNEGYLADISSIYALISFLAVVVITKIYISVYKMKESKK